MGEAYNMNTSKPSSNGDGHVALLDDRLYCSLNASCFRVRLGTEVAGDMYLGVEPQSVDEQER